ncbi:MAG TPA: serine protein kinase RIO [archaeon]|nr:serine protein kinase RIO [archaeon]
MKPKIRLEEIKDFKIERKVFDDRTLLAIYKLMLKGIVKSVESVAKEGKESVVLSARDKDGNWIALKVYRIQYCDFKSMWKYLAGDPRFKGLKKNRRMVVYTWCRREFSNLRTVFEAGVSCPKPISFYENVLVTGLIGKDGELAPMLSDLKFNQEDAQFLYDFTLDQVERIAKAGLVHSDLSAYNILFYEKPYIIDFSQTVQLKHPLSKKFLIRDLSSINSYFKKLNVKLKLPEEVLSDLLKIGDWE